MATVAQMRQGLATALNAGLNGVQVSPYVLPSPTPPSAHVVLSSVDYQGAMHVGLVTYNFVIQTFIAAGLDEVAQMKLDEFIDTTAILAAIDADPTLGGIIGRDAVIVDGVTAYNRVVVEGKEMFSADYAVRVLD